jgi:hypothetical protein
MEVGTGKERAATGSASLDEVGSFADGRVREERWRCCRVRDIPHRFFSQLCIASLCTDGRGMCSGLGYGRVYIDRSVALRSLPYPHPTSTPLLSILPQDEPHASTDIHPSVLIPYRPTNIMVSLTSLTSLLPLLLLALPGQAAPAPEKRYNVQVIDNCSNQGQVALTFDGTSFAHLTRYLPVRIRDWLTRARWALSV